MSYANFDELKRGVIDRFTANTTAERFKRGLNRVAAPGMEACPDTAEFYDRQTDRDAAELLVERWSRSRLFRREERGEREERR
ncbi:hypothetical protein M1N47_00240 [Dehalococcoidia bacterium]|nr:hypothetical protein [Dehalococcoidia bacterium]